MNSNNKLQIQLGNQMPIWGVGARLGWSGETGHPNAIKDPSVPTNKMSYIMRGFIQDPFL